MSQKVVLKLSADWCGPCKKIAPFFHDLSKKYTDIKFIEVNVEDNFTDFHNGLSGPQIAEKYPSNGIPYFVFLHNDEKVADMTGANELKLHSEVEKLHSI
jgi:thioredoxin 1